jgi:hypothetical protein
MSRALPIADAFCAQEAEAAGEPLAGTAAHALAWVLVEESGAWERDPLDSPGLAEERATIEGWLATIPKSRLQLIRRPRASTGGRRVFLAMRSRWSRRHAARRRPTSSGTRCTSYARTVDATAAALNGGCRSSAR